ncbi:hypothetical protein CEXT_346141 [Caerostris extrusa]|uniref:Uncharacterized protein n=1 Tax=Caerostris extrusa TaxID=172846 RepID=A0AAV4UKY8_CAEEX|nr:hypothetical protein CEXT_346141 [Caerostris extrusa]
MEMLSYLPSGLAEMDLPPSGTLSGQRLWLTVFGDELYCYSLRLCYPNRRRVGLKKTNVTANKETKNHKKRVDHYLKNIQKIDSSPASTCKLTQALRIWKQQIQAGL